jgi:site-specific recombinase XerC
MKGWGRFSRQGLSVSWARAVKRVSDQKVKDGEPPLPHLHPYVLRHSFATLVLDATGGDLQQTKELLQHADLATTLTYTRARVSSSLVDAVAKVAAVAPTRCPHQQNTPQNGKVTRLPKPVRRVRFP